MRGRPVSVKSFPLESKYPRREALSTGSHYWYILESGSHRKAGARRRATRRVLTAREEDSLLKCYSDDSRISA
jgi:hypothetical protein